MKIALLAAALASVSTAALAQTYQRTDTGIVVTPAQGPEGAVRLQVYGDEIIRVTSSSDARCRTSAEPDGDCQAADTAALP